MKIDVNKPPFVCATDNGGQHYVHYLGVEIAVLDRRREALANLVLSLNRRAALWAKAVEAELNKSADAILADMQKDSAAYKAGYAKSAESFQKILLDSIARLPDGIDEATRSVLRQWVKSARRLLPDPDPDGQGFTDRYF